MNARLPDFFIGKEMETKRAWLWLLQVEVYLETHHLKLDKIDSLCSNTLQNTHVGLVVI